MPWINDVVPYSTILSTWGNSVRNHVVFDFASQADRDTHNSTLTDGAVCWTADTKSLWVKRDGAWRPIVPALIDAAVVNANGYYLTPGVKATIFTYNLPAGYTRALFNLSVLAHGVGGPMTSGEAQILLSGGLVGASQGRFDVLQSTSSLSATASIPIGGASGTVTYENQSGAPNDLAVNGNGYYTRCSILCLP